MVSSSSCKIFWFPGGLKCGVLMVKLQGAVVWCLFREGFGALFCFSNLFNFISFFSSLCVLGYRSDNMGKLLSKIFGNREMRILMLGLDAAGKTSIFYLLYLVT